MRALGFDPSSKPGETAWCLVEVLVVGQPRWLTHGKTTTDERSIGALLIITKPDLVVVELPEHVHPRGSNKGPPPLSLLNQLLKMSRAGNEIMLTCARRGVAAVDVGAPAARAYLGVGRSPKDAAIKRAVTLRVSDVPSRTQNHHRDACAAAICGAAKWRRELAMARSTRAFSERS